MGKLSNIAVVATNRAASPNIDRDRFNSFVKSYGQQQHRGSRFDWNLLDFEVISSGFKKDFTGKGSAMQGTLVARRRHLDGSHTVYTATAHSDGLALHAEWRLLTSARKYFETNKIAGDDITDVILFTRASPCRDCTKNYPGLWERLKDAMGYGEAARLKVIFELYYAQDEPDVMGSFKHLPPDAKERFFKTKQQAREAYLVTEKECPGIKFKLLGS